MQAISDFSNCIRLHPSYDGKVYIARAKAYGKIGMVIQAQKDLQNCSKLDPKYARGKRAIAVDRGSARLCNPPVNKEREV